MKVPLPPAENWVVPMLVQCDRDWDAIAVAMHFEGTTYTLSNGRLLACAAGVGGDEPSSCMISPSVVSPVGAKTRLLDRDHLSMDDAVRVALGVVDSASAFTLQERLELGNLLYGAMRTAPSFNFAIAGLELADTGTDDISAAYPAMLRDPACDGLVVRVESWRAAGEPPGFEPFRDGYVWRPYLGKRRMSTARPSVMTLH